MMPSNLNIPLEKIRNILVIKFRYIGDSIWLLPFVENLKRNLPNAKITVMVNEGTEAFFHLSPAVDSVIAYPRKEVTKGIGGLFRAYSFVKELRRRKFDMVIELSDSDRPAILSYLSGAEIRLGFNNENRWRRFLLTHILKGKIEEKHMVEYHLDVLRELGMTIYDTSIKVPLDKKVFQSLKDKYPSLFINNKKKKVIVHPGSRGPLRQWGTANFAYLCDILSDTCRIFLVSGPNEKEILQEIRSSMKVQPEICTHDLSLFEFAALCELSDLFIGNDSGPIHIASVKTFTVGIYGPTLPEIVSPWTEKKLLIDPGSLWCRPCNQKKCVNEEYKACILKINREEVSEKVKQLLPTLETKSQNYF